jgi:hypothetical protein
MLIKLEPWEYEYASYIGIRRFTANWDKSDASYYDRSRMEDDRTAQVASAICELAVAKAMNQYWTASIWDESKHENNKFIPDVGINIEVRRVRTKSGPAVRHKDLNRDLIIVGAIAIAPEFKEVEVLGWIRAEDGWNIGIQESYGKIIPRERLNQIGY